jgi:hypothetical protein
MVYAKVMGDPHGPREEFAFLGISAASDSIYDPDKNVLENIFGKILVFDQEEDRGVQLFLMAEHKDFKGIDVAAVERADQLVIGQSG